MADSKLAVITGANSGVGKEATRLLVRSGWSVVMVCRSEGRASQAMAEIRSETPTADLHLEICDLGVLDQVRSLANRLDAWLNARDRSLDALVNNAGLYSAQLAHTPDGFERTMAVNHLSHYLLTRLLEARLRRPGVRVVNVSSEAHRRAKLGGRDLDDVLAGRGPYKGMRAYCDSKLANVLFTEELQRRWGADGTAVASVHPGLLSTGFWDHERNLVAVIMRLMKPLMGAPARGGEAVARLVEEVAPGDMRGAYYDETDRADARLPNDADRLARRLWDVSAKAVGLGS